MKHTSTATNLFKYFKNPIVQGLHKVRPAYQVPEHIIRPQYALDHQNPVYGIYHGDPVVHAKQAVESNHRKSAKIVSRTLFEVEKYAKAGMTTDDIDKFVHNCIIEQGAYPTPIGFMNFPKSVCTSVNEVLVHGIPDERVLEEGDTMNVDSTAYYDGYHGDSNLMIQIGKVHPDIRKVIDTTRKAVYEAIKICKPGVKFNKIGQTIQKVVKAAGLHVCPLFNGHGIGHLLHMPPQVEPWYNPNYPYAMQPGNVFTIQPIITLFPVYNVIEWKDNFTVVSPNNPNAQFEHTVFINDDGCEVLTLRQGEKIE